MKKVHDPAAAEFERLSNAGQKSEGKMIAVSGAASPQEAQMQNVQDTLNSFRSYDADQLRIQLEWVGRGRARLLVNGEPLLSDAGLPLTLFTNQHRAAAKLGQRTQSEAA